MKAAKSKNRLIAKKGKTIVVSKKPISKISKNNKFVKTAVKKVVVKKPLPKIVVGISKKGLVKSPVKSSVTNNKSISKSSIKKNVVFQKPPKVIVKPKEIKPFIVDTEEQYPIMNQERQLIVGTLHEPGKKADHKSGTIVIVSHGFLSSRKFPLLQTLCVALARSGFSAYRFDFSGNGDSEGRFEDSTPHKQIRELGLIVKHFKERYAKVYLLGHSLGGALSVAVGATGVADGVITIAPPMHVDRVDNILTPEQKEQMLTCGFTILKVRRSVGEVPYTLQATFLEEARSLDPLSLASYIKCPALLVHGTHDRIVPLEDTNSLFGSIGSSDKDVLLIGGGDHNLMNPEHQDAVVSGVINWMKKHKQ